MTSKINQSNRPRTNIRLIGCCQVIIILFTAILLCSSPVYAQTPLLKVVLIGPRPYQAPTGQATEMMVEILNSGPGEVSLIRGDIILTPTPGYNLLLHSESLGNFHLDFLQSAIWTFNLTMPNTMQVVSLTGDVPQSNMLIRVTYSSPRFQELTSNANFDLGVPGATLKHTDDSTWLLILAIVILCLTVGSTVVFWKRLRRPRRTRRK